MPAPSRGAAFISSTTLMVPDGETSAMIWRIELLPMSIAEMRTSPSASVLEVVLDLFSFGEIDGIFSDISREIGHALEISAYEKKLE